MDLNFYKAFAVLFLLVSLSIFNAQAQTSVTSKQDDIEDDLKLVPCKSAERLEAVKKLFLKMGAKESDVSSSKFEKGENLLIKIKGKTDETVVVGAHYDKVEAGCGAIDNWTGIVILAHLYKTLSQYEVDKSYIFVAFDKEEDGLLGSKALIKTIPKENYPKYCAAVNIDSFGFTAPQAAVNMSDYRMIKIAKKIAERTGTAFNDAAISGADGDSSTFLSKRIPAITFHGLGTNWKNFLHTTNDKPEHVNARSVYVGYRFIFEYLAELESVGCRTYDKY